MKAWREVATPHNDVLAGTLKQSEFAADLSRVAAGTASPEYQVPVQFFNRTYTKSDFSSCLDDNTQKTGVLLGIVLDRAEGDNLIFAASVGSPDALSDEYIPILLTVSRMGDVSIKRDTTMDTSASAEDEEDGV